MTITMTAHQAEIKVEPGLSIFGPTSNGMSQAVSPVDDTSSPSPPNSELFDRQGPYAAESSRSWLRYGSLESGASTGITSNSSSMIIDDQPTDLQSLPSPSKKRKLDTPTRQPSIFLSSGKSVNPVEKPRSSAPQSARQQRQKATLSRDRDGNDTKPRPRSSIPSSLPANQYANQCIEAAIGSRLDPYSLHQGEHDLLVKSLTSGEVTVYLNIRNSILRLWLRNPLCRVTEEEAAGCAKDSRFFGLAEVAHQWLSRNGYINFGCIDVNTDAKPAGKARKGLKQRTVVVVGAGVSGLTTARQLENHFSESMEEWLERGERPPRVVVIEGRKRIGGRVYSKPLRSQTDKHMPGQYRNTAEMGAMIVTGFERGNPLDVIIRGQLGLHYHLLRDALTIYDCNGKPVDHAKDMLNTDLYTDISDRTGDFRVPPRRRDTLKGDEELINRCRDPTSNASTHLQLEPFPQDLDPSKQRKPISKRGRRVNAPPGTEKLTGRSQVAEGGAITARAARAAHEMGWKMREGVSKHHTVSLKALAETHQGPSLGRIMDAAIIQYQSLLEFDPEDMQLLNWHHANLEYANAAPVSWLSLSGHDQDNGNEFEGAHSEVVGGYTQVPRGLMNLPTKLDVRFNHVVQKIKYKASTKNSPSPSATVVCTNGEVIEADRVVITTPLGVLKSDMIEFDPPLPDWKRGAITNMGFGLLNKLILVYDEPFWDESRDMFGLLNKAEEEGSMDPRHYERKRGRFYLIWNASKISGRPMLVALMAGHAAYEAEITDTPKLLSEVTERLRSVFSDQIPAPREVIVTRWRQDPFSRGTYSYIAPWTQPGDYDLMARPTGNLHFAGEATCGTHPATVHGALLSGLRAASEVLDAMTGPIELPRPLVEASTNHSGSPAHAASRVPTKMTPQAETKAIRPTVEVQQLPASVDNIIPPQIIEIPKYYYGNKKPSGPPLKSVCPGDPSFWVSLTSGRPDPLLETRIQSAIEAAVGERPVKPARAGVNPFLLYSREKWEECKTALAKGDSKAGQNAVRQVLGQWWRALDGAKKQPYLEQSKLAQDTADAEQKRWKLDSEKWDGEARRVREDFMRTYQQENGGAQHESVETGGRKTNVSTNIALDFSDLR